MDAHYKNIAENYYYFYGPYKSALVRNVLINHLQLEPDDQLLDLGAGPGLVTTFIRDIVDLKNPVTCVEPCGVFIEQLNKLDGVAVVHNTAEGFYDELKQNVVDGKIKAPFNKVLMAGVIHHITNPIRCLDNIIDHLPKGGICVIEEHRKDIYPYPFARALLQEICSLPTVSLDVLPYLQKRTDAITEQRDEFFSWEVEKKRWYGMIRGRYLSYFEKWSDDELEKSIEELEEERFGGLKDDDKITIQDNVLVTKITKL